MRQQRSYNKKTDNQNGKISLSLGIQQDERQ